MYLVVMEADNAWRRYKTFRVMYLVVVEADDAWRRYLNYATGSACLLDLPAKA